MADGVQAQELEQQIAAAFDWWRLAGVDAHYASAPTDWLAQPEPIVAAPTTSKAPAVQSDARPATDHAKLSFGDPATWPGSLDAFQAWWVANGAIEAGGIGDRVPPTGPADADTMFLCEQPDPAGGPEMLGGMQGKFLGALLSAMRIDPSRTYLAAALPRPVPLADWQAMAMAGLDRLTAHHVALAAPQRVIVFGRNIWSLLEHGMAQASPDSWIFNHEGRSIPAMAARPLETLMGSATAKARFWNDWLEWTDDTP